MIEFHDIEQRTDVWKSLRCGKVGGSEAIGLSTPARMKTLIYKKVSELVTGEVKEIFQNDAMRWGVEHEPEAKKKYTEETFESVEEVGYITNDDYIFAGLSPDGRVNPKKYVEIKCPNSENHVKTILTDAVPSEYVPQINQYFMILPDVEEVDFVSYDPRVKSYPLYIKTVRREDVQDSINKHIKSYEKFEADIVEALKLFEE